jgi:hypothetical protein
MSDNAAEAGERFRNTWPIVNLVPAHISNTMFPKLLSEGKHSLRALARAYFVTEVGGQALYHEILSSGASASSDAPRRSLAF